MPIPSKFIKGGISDLYFVKDINFVGDEHILK